MREKIVVNVQEGGKLQLSYADKAVGPQITIPQGVTSVTVIVRDTAGFEQARAKRAGRRGARAEARRARVGQGAVKAAP